jgi:hypothetical protein
MSGFENLKKHWLTGVVVLVSATAGSTWYLANELLVKPRNFQLEMREDEAERLKDTIEQLRLELRKQKNPTDVTNRVPVDANEPVFENSQETKPIPIPIPISQKPKLEWSFWAYYGRYKNGHFMDGGGPSFFIDKKGQTQKRPEEGDEITARKVVNARANSGRRADALGVLCPGEKVLVEEVAVVKSSKGGGDYIWVRMFDRLWESGYTCDMSTRHNR